MMQRMLQHDRTPNHLLVAGGGRDDFAESDQRAHVDRQAVLDSADWIKAYKQ